MTTQKITANKVTLADDCIHRRNFALVFDVPLSLMCRPPAVIWDAIILANADRGMDEGYKGARNCAKTRSSISGTDSNLVYDGRCRAP